MEPFRTNGKDAAVTTTYYSDPLASIVTDVRNIKSAVGRVETGKQWGLIDWDLRLARAAFDHEDPSSDDDDF